MRRKTLITLAIVVAAGVAGVLFFPEKKDPAAEHLAEGTRIWQDAVWHPERTRFGDAIAPLDLAGKLGREDPNLFFMLGTAVLLEGGGESAFPLLKKLESLEPKHAGLPLAYGLWEQQKMQPRTARSAFHSSVQLVEAWAQDAPLREEIEFLARRGRSASDTHLGTFSRASNDYAQIFAALERHGGQPTLDDYMGLANARFRLNENPAAIALLDRALAAKDANGDPLWPGHPHLLLSRALILADEGADGAGDALRQAAVADPDNPAIVLKLAELARKDGRLPQMHLNLSKVRALIDRLAPSRPRHIVKTWNAEYLGGLARYHLDYGLELQAAGDEDAAVESFVLSLKHARDSAAGWDACFRVHTTILKLGTLIDVPQDEIENSRRAIKLRSEQAPSLSDASRTFC